MYGGSKGLRGWGNSVRRGLAIGPQPHCLAWRTPLFSHHIFDEADHRPWPEDDLWMPADLQNHTGNRA